MMIQEIKQKTLYIRKATKSESENEIRYKFRRKREISPLRNLNLDAYIEVHIRLRSGC